MKIIQPVVMVTIEISRSGRIQMWKTREEENKKITWQ